MQSALCCWSFLFSEILNTKTTVRTVIMLRKDPGWEVMEIKSKPETLPLLNSDVEKIINYKSDQHKENRLNEVQFDFKINLSSCCFFSGESAERESQIAAQISSWSLHTFGGGVDGWLYLLWWDQRNPLLLWRGLSFSCRCRLLTGFKFHLCFIVFSFSDLLKRNYELWFVKSDFYIFSLSYSFYGVLWKESRHLECGWYRFKPVLLWIQDFRDMLPRSKGNALLRRLFEMEMTVD